MKHNSSMQCALLMGFGAILISISLSRAEGAEPPPESKPQKPVQAAAAPHKKTRNPPTGAELYAIHCNRCHPERYAPERTETQWKTILTHMRVRANLPATQARAIMRFLQEESGK
ncbi:MAG TPA: hypothetical protein VKY92_23145 [Verrucomicrobiae bacterium]|nr:hypothetical protein [Verrucomicrobiae bacterium]